MEGPHDRIPLHSQPSDLLGGSEMGLGHIDEEKVEDGSRTDDRKETESASRLGTLGPVPLLTSSAL